MPLTLGDTLPSLLVKATSGKTIDLLTLTGKNVVIYFYPKDATPGCTTEAQDFRDLMHEFAQLNCEIFGVSRDSLNSHEKFKANECLPFESWVLNVVPSYSMLKASYNKNGVK